MSSSEPNMNDYVDFAAYLHNPWAYPSKKELAAMMIFKRKERFVENYSWQIDLLELIRHYFGNIDQPQKNRKQNGNTGQSNSIGK